jgi:hypothetical protein
MFKRNYPETIEAYSADLKRRLRGVLPDEKIEEVLSETRAHLEDSAAALKMEPKTAEARAISEFTKPKQLARGFIRAWSAKYLRHRGTRLFQNLNLITVSFFLLFYAMLYIFASFNPVYHYEGKVNYFDDFIRFVIKITNLYFKIHVGANEYFYILMFSVSLSFLSCRNQLRRFLWGCLTFSVFVLVFSGLSNGANSSLIFDIDKSKSRTLNFAFLYGVFIVTDIVGGYLGGVMLRFIRRRRSIGETRLKS